MGLACWYTKTSQKLQKSWIHLGTHEQRIKDFRKMRRVEGTFISLVSLPLVGEGHLPTTLSFWILYPRSSINTTCSQFCYYSLWWMFFTELIMGLHFYREVIFSSSLTLFMKIKWIITKSSLVRLGKNGLIYKVLFREDNTISGTRRGTNYISNVCVHTHVHTCEHEYRLTEQVNMIISEDKQQKKATYLTYTTTVS